MGAYSLPSKLSIKAQSTTSEPWEDKKVKVHESTVHGLVLTTA